MLTNSAPFHKPPEPVEYLLCQPNYLYNHLSATKTEIKLLSLTKRRKIYNYYAFADLVRRSSKASNLIFLNVYESNERVKITTTAFLAAGRRINDEFKRNRQVINMRLRLNELLESIHLMNTCMRNKMYTEAIAIVK